MGRQLSACPYAAPPLSRLQVWGASIDESIIVPTMFDFKGLESDSKILLIK